MNAAHLTHRQRGASLIVALLFLIVLTVLGLVAVRSSTLHERMAGNDRDKATAFEAAEAALRDAERDIFLNLTAGNSFDAACSAGLCLPSTNATPQWNSVDWTDDAVSRLYGDGSGAGDYPVDVDQPPRYIVELLPDVPPGAGNSMNANARSSTTGGTAYRITARGWGRRPGTTVLLQSLYVKQ